MHSLVEITGLSVCKIIRELNAGAGNSASKLHEPMTISEWEAEMVRHAEFFGGLSPKEEYKRHSERRNNCAEKV